VFSTFLKSITDYFSTRALMSAVLPNLIFWLATAVTVQLGRKRWDWGALAADWRTLKFNEETLLVVALSLWVAFFSLLTLNFHSTLLRLYEGYWPFAGLAALRRGHWQRRWGALDERDRGLEAQEVLLEREREGYRSLRESRPAAAAGPPPPEAGVTEADFKRLAVLEKEVGELERLLGVGAGGRGLGARDAGASASRVGWEITSDGPGPDRLAGLAALGSEVRAAWKVYTDKGNGVAVGGDAETPYGLGLDRLTGRLVALVEGQWGEAEERRLRHNHEFFLAYPPQRDDVMPTLLGNVLKAAEARVRLRYNLDAVLVWPRLQPLLGKDVAASVESTKSSLDLMLTVSFGVLLFGVPLSVWSAFQTGSWFLWWGAPPALLALACAARLWVAAVPAAAALLLGLVLSLLGPAGGAGEAVRAAEVTLTLLAGLLLLSWVCYHNAVQACLVYGEKVQSMFDLYRWDVLDKLHLQWPTDNREERGLWGDVCGLLYRGYDPSPEYYRYVRDQAKTRPPGVGETVRLPVPARPLPAYRPIGPDEIVEADVPVAEAHADAVRDVAALAGMIPLVALPVAKPLRAALLGTRERLQDHVAVGVEIASAQALGGKVAVGDLLDIVITPTAGGDPARYQDVLVLDASAGSAGVVMGSLGSATAQSITVLVLALPRDAAAGFVALKAAGNVLVTRRIPPANPAP
jgi:hypothetical protein